MRNTIVRVGLMVALVGAGADRAAAQDARPGPVFNGVAGYAGFIDESMDGRFMLGGGARVYLTKRIAIGPEFVYLRGPSGDHDWTLTADASIDLLRDRPAGQAGRVMPYVAVGGGFVSQTRRVGTGPYTSAEGTVSGGAGLRIPLGRRLFIAPEIRIGWEPTIRAGVAIGVR